MAKDIVGLMLDEIELERMESLEGVYDADLRSDLAEAALMRERFGIED